MCRRNAASWPPDGTVHSVSHEAISTGLSMGKLQHPMRIASCDIPCTVASGGQDAVLRLGNKVRLLVRPVCLPELRWERNSSGHSWLAACYCLCYLTQAKL